MDNPVDVFADHPQGEEVIRRRENPLFDYPLFVDREEQGTMERVFLLPHCDVD